ncbi:MAG: CxxC-x17-CxxC domain-containing protein [Candidatus Buchananbacteria bacterium]
MRNFSQDSRSDRPRGDRGFKRQDFGDNRGGRPGMHQAVCSGCGNKCEVPFRPTGDRPVYCSSCFEKQGNSGSPRTGGRSFSKPSFGDKRMFEAVCAKCGNKCEVPFRPTGDKPVYCSSCFDKGNSSSAPVGKSLDQYKQQFEILNSKLDKVLKALNLQEIVKAPKEAKPKSEPKPEAKKPAAKKAAAKPAAKKAAKKSAKGGSALGGKK